MVLLLQKRRVGLGREREIEEYNFEEEMRSAEHAVKEMRAFTDDEWFLYRLRLVSNVLENLQELYDKAVGNEDAGAGRREKKESGLRSDSGRDVDWKDTVEETGRSEDTDEEDNGFESFGYAGGGNAGARDADDEDARNEDGGYESADDEGAGEDVDDENDEDAGAEDEDDGWAMSEKEEFTLCYARLDGLAEQFTALGRKRPESACGTFKAQQVN